MFIPTYNFSLKLGATLITTPSTPFINKMPKLFMNPFSTCYHKRSIPYTYLWKDLNVNMPIVTEI